MLPGVAPPKTVNWGFGRGTGCLQLCQDSSLSSTPIYEHTHTCLHTFGSILHSVTLVASASPCCGLCQTGWAWLLTLRGLCAPFTPLQETPRHTLPGMYPRTQHDNETPPAWAPFGQHPHVAGCAHKFLCAYLHTHTRMQTHPSMDTFIYAHSHVLTCTRVCTHISAFKYLHPLCVQTYTVVPTHVPTGTLVHGHMFTGTHRDVSTCREA